ncbi:putative ribonuclease H-like domain-containing protein, partial [Tanacetum coccineum]
KIEEEVYVCQPPGFENPDFPDRVYKVETTLYGLHQAPRAWYETLSTYLLDNGFQRGKIDKTLFIKRHKVEDDKEIVELKQCLEIIPDEEEGRIVKIRSLLDAVWNTAAHVCVNAAQLELELLRDFKENILSVYYC